MASNFQDDEREISMIQLFNLHKDEEEGRAGVDAYLDLDGKKVPFELKTTSKGSVTTVRDFGLSHVEKWKDKHWLIGFFIKGREYYKYGSPSMMAPWIEEKKRYIEPDMKLATLLPLNRDFRIRWISGDCVVFDIRQLSQMGTGNGARGTVKMGVVH